MTFAARVDVPVEALLAGLLNDIDPIPDVEIVPTGNILGRVTADFVRSPSDLPRVDIAAMDGFGLADDDLEGGLLTLNLAPVPRLAAGTTIRLYTGSPIPPGVSAVARRERASERNGEVIVEGSFVPYADIRRAAEDVRRGDEIVARGTVIGIRHIPVLHSAGVMQLPVRRRVRVTVLSTGNELRALGEPIVPGAVIDANRPMLRALFDQPHIEVRDGGIHPDDPAALAAALAAAAVDSDLIVCSGGTAGSEVDPVVAAVRLTGGSASSHRLALRPGRPIVTGRIGSAIFLGLPGNPFAALVTAQLVAQPILLALAGASRARCLGESAILAHDLLRTPGRTEFVPGAIAGRTPAGDWLVTARTGRQAGVGQLARADGVIELAGPEKAIAAGSRVAFYRDALG